MGCARGLCTSDKIFIFINIAFAMYSGALLATAARLAWDPSTYAWFRFLCAAQYRVSAAYVLAAGLWLAALAGGAVWAGGSHQRALRWYSAGVGALLVSQVAVGAWLCTSLAAWWRSAPQAELARRGLDLLHDLKPALLAVERYRDVARPLYDMIEEVEREAPNNAYVIIIFGLVAFVLEVTALVMAWRMSRRSEGARLVRSSSLTGAREARAGAGGADDDSDGAEPPATRSPPTSPGWRKTANLRMYTILDKIF